MTVAEFMRAGGTFLRRNWLLCLLGVLQSRLAWESGPRRDVVLLLAAQACTAAFLSHTPNF